MSLDSDLIVVSATPTISTSAYTTACALGGLLAFTGYNMSERFTITKIVILDKSNQKSAVDVIIAAQSIAATTNGAPIAIGAADLPNIASVVSLTTTDYVSIGTVACATKILANNGLDLRITDPGGKLYGQMIVRGTPTYVAASDLTIQLTLRIWKG
jgi:hypothetical protein